ncbi:hypothetical protein CDD82_3947 [Ophiocordyceps australis]|uniref:Uncharacterized protein n=1 Tax=Ophiocordyceps australis TaxID=1399860 RepID=A0A2C5ZA13_9HYPO|nr:hypothetical protein CDD82_3947 [Ophiocordyceps australis]
MHGQPALTALYRIPCPCGGSTHGQRYLPSTQVPGAARRPTGFPTAPGLSPGTANGKGHESLSVAVHVRKSAHGERKKSKAVASPISPAHAHSHAHAHVAHVLVQAETTCPGILSPPQDLASTPTKGHRCPQSIQPPPPASTSTSTEWHLVAFSCSLLSRRVGLAVLAPGSILLLSALQLLAFARHHRPSRHICFHRSSHSLGPFAAHFPRLGVGLALILLPSPRSAALPLCPSLSS